MRAMHGGASAKATILIKHKQARQLLAQYGRGVLLQQLERERIKKRIYLYREATILDISVHIDAFYNPIRCHSQLRGISPDEFEATHHQHRSGVH